MIFLSSAIDAARKFIGETNGIVHVDEILYPLFIQALYPKHTTQIESYIELLYQVWLDPSPENIIFLPDFMQDKFVHLPTFEEVVRLVYPEDHHEKIAFLDFMITNEKISQAFISIFAEEIKFTQRQKLSEQGVRIVTIKDAEDHEGPHMIVLTYMQKLPTYNGETQTILIEEQRNIISNFGHHPQQEPVIDLIEGAQRRRPGTFLAENDKGNALPEVLPIPSIKLLFNDLQLFCERYILNVRPPYQPTHHISTKALKEFLLFNKPIATRTVFDQHQIIAIKEGFEKFKATLPKGVIWNQNVLYDVPGTTQTLHGTIDLIWDGGLYQLTKKTPPSRSALLNGIDPELPLLAASYDQSITHVGYIHLKGQGEDVITITRYNDPSVLAYENIKKLEHILSYNHSRSEEESS